MPRWLILFAFASSLAACRPVQGMTEQRHSNLLDLARTDLQCEDVRYANLGNQVYAAEGCGKSTSYLLYCYGPACRWVTNPGAIAVKNMACPPASIRMRRENRSAYVFEGCGERQRYKLEGYTWYRRDE
jgi:hypothetical protein